MPQYGAGDPGGDALDQIAGLVAHVRSQALTPFTQAEAAPGACSAACARVNLSRSDSRYLVLQFATPAADGAAPAGPLLTYNLAHVTATDFGYGWTFAYRRSVADLGHGNANLNTSTGDVQAFLQLDASNYYLPPGEANNSLKKETSGWTETQPDGTRFRYDGGGGPAGQPDQRCLRRGREPYPGDEPAGADHDRRVRRGQPVGGPGEPAGEPDIVRP
jgi:hypothetical protein